MAHLLEHVAYMGSPKRQLISGTGSRTNAYTDFHHTVFYAACPTQTPDQFWKKPMLPMALVRYACCLYMCIDYVLTFDFYIIARALNTYIHLHLYSYIHLIHLIYTLYIPYAPLTIHYRMPYWT